MGSQVLSLHLDGEADPGRDLGTEESLDAGANSVVHRPERGQDTLLDVQFEVAGALGGLQDVGKFGE